MRTSPLAIPDAFDTLTDADKRAYLNALRERYERSSIAEPAEVESAIRDEVGRRMDEVHQGSAEFVRADGVFDRLREKYDAR